MAIILSIETSTPISSIALHDSGQLIAQQSIHKNKSHSEFLVPSIKNLCEMSGVIQNEIKAIGISEGPGSYTGLRIGTSSAKGLCYGLEVPLIAVSTLAAMAIGVMKYTDEQLLFCPMLDARRMEVYCLIMDSNESILEPISAKIIDEESFQELLVENKIIFFGDGSAKCKPALESNPNARFIEDIYPSAVHIGELAWTKFNNKQFEDLAYFEPFYLKDFIAKKPSAKKLV